MQRSQQLTLTGGLGLAAIAGLTGAVAAVSWRVADALVHPRRLAVWRQPSDFGLKHEDVSFPTPDGIRIRGWLIRGLSDAAIVLAHGQARNRADLLGVARILHDYGYTTLLIDHRACGESDGDVETFGVTESTDLIAAAGLLRGLGWVDPNRIGALGWSMGGASALLAAGRSTALRAVVSDSAFACLEQLVRENFERLTRLPTVPFAPLLVRFAERQSGISRREARPMDAMPSINPRPVLLIHGQADRIVPFRHARLLVEAATGPVETWFPEGVDHVGASEADPAGYIARVTDFFKRTLRS